MSVSAAKRLANRSNAQKSTGPRTAEGKARSSRNAIIHGIFCQDLQFLTEDPHDLLDLRDDVLRRMRPRDAFEAEVVEQYLHCAWRLRRVRKTEMHVYQQRAQKMMDRLALPAHCTADTPRL